MADAVVLEATEDSSCGFESRRWGKQSKICLPLFVSEKITREHHLFITDRKLFELINVGCDSLFLMIIGLLRFMVIRFELTIFYPVFPAKFKKAQVKFIFSNGIMDKNEI